MTDTASGNVLSATCPSRAALEVVGSKWALLIVPLLARQPLRNNELLRQVGGISQKMLTQTLRDLERDGLVRRTIYAEIPPRVEYELTPLGHTLCGPLGSLTQWAHDNFEEVKKAQAEFDSARAAARS